jgi:divinyl protochlorophyllide a 8-vinyl-reductase
MDRQSLQADGMIGPNALTQFRSPLEEQGGQDLFETLLHDARIASLPDMSGLIPEGPVARFHKTVRATLPDLSAEISRAAGVGTADYVLKHRIPSLAQTLLKVLPASLSKHLLANAISRNAWTFAGSGQFEVAGRTPLVFILKRQSADRRGTRRSSNLPLAYGCFRAVVPGTDRPASPCHRDGMRSLRGGCLPV